jgi:hypothetical protein
LCRHAGNFTIVTRKEKAPRKGYGVALGNAMAEFEVLLNPAAEHRIEEQRRVEIAPDEVGIELDETDGKVHIVPPTEPAGQA